jgi:hypothetical protein
MKALVQKKTNLIPFRQLSFAHIRENLSRLQNFIQICDDLVSPRLHRVGIARHFHTHSFVFVSKNSNVGQSLLVLGGLHCVSPSSLTSNGALRKVEKSRRNSQFKQKIINPTCILFKKLIHIIDINTQYSSHIGQKNKPQKVNLFVDGSVFISFLSKLVCHS